MHFLEDAFPPEPLYVATLNLAFVLFVCLVLNDASTLVGH